MQQNYNNLTMGALDKNLWAREQEIYLNQVEASWKVDHQPSGRQQADWIKALIGQMQTVLTMNNRQMASAIRK